MDINDFITQLEIVLDCKGEGYIQCLEKAKMIKEKMWELKKEKDMLERQASYDKDSDDDDDDEYTEFMYEGVKYLYNLDDCHVIDPQDFSVVGKFKHGQMTWEGGYGEKQHQRNKLVV